MTLLFGSRASHGGSGFISRGGLLVPSGSPPAGFNPASIGTLQAWYEADSLALADNTGLVSVSDLSGNGRTGAGSATFKTGIVNSKPVFRFNGTSDRFIYDAGAAFLTGASLTAIMVLARSSVTSGRALSLTADGETQDWQNVGSAIPVNHSSPNYELYRNNGLRNSIAAGALGAFGIVVSRFNGVTNLLRRNGVAGTAGATDNNNFNVRYLGIGRQANTSAEFQAMDVALVLVYSSAVSDANILAAESFYTTKYAL